MLGRMLIHLTQKAALFGAMQAGVGGASVCVCVCAAIVVFCFQKRRRFSSVFLSVSSRLEGQRRVRAPSGSGYVTLPARGAEPQGDK